MLCHRWTRLNGGLVVNHKHLAGVSAFDLLATHGHIGNGLLLEYCALFNGALRRWVLFDILANVPVRWADLPIAVLIRTYHPRSSFQTLIATLSHHNHSFQLVWIICIQLLQLKSPLLYKPARRLCVKFLGVPVISRTRLILLSRLLHSVRLLLLLLHLHVWFDSPSTHVVHSRGMDSLRNEICATRIRSEAS